MASLKDKYAIVGVGHSALGKVPELSDYGLAGDGGQGRP